MASYADEFLAESYLIPGSILEVGCQPGIFTARIAKSRRDRVVGIDINPCEVIDGFAFIRGDVVDYAPGCLFDNIVCVSSFEHCGIEGANYKTGLSRHLVVAEKLKSLLSPNGRIIITCPFGPNETHLVTAEGEFPLGKVPPDSVVQWGYRTFDHATLCSIFAPLISIQANAMEWHSRHYADAGSWRPVALDSAKDFAGGWLRGWRGVIGIAFGRAR